MAFKRRDWLSVVEGDLCLVLEFLVTIVEFLLVHAKHSIFFGPDITQLKYVYIFICMLYEYCYVHVCYSGVHRFAIFYCILPYLFSMKCYYKCRVISYVNECFPY